MIEQNGAPVFNTLGTQNLFVGASAGNLTLTTASASQNTAIGNSALNAVTVGAGNTAIGYQALFKATIPNFNVAVGRLALINLLTGSNNTACGYQAGQAYTGTEANNICIGASVVGTVGESNVIRIGNASNTTCFIAGINGVTVTGTAVLCATNGQLGTIASSIRYKENIAPINSADSVMELNPVQFTYKADGTKTTQYGLIAEDVDKQFPYLCFYKDGIPESVKYHELPTLLLHEIQKLNARILALEYK